MLELLKLRGNIKGIMAQGKTSSHSNSESGILKINDQMLTAPCVFVIERGEIARPVFLTDVRLIVVKIPGILNDKYEINEATE